MTFNLITIDGKEYMLRYPGLVQIEIEKKAGKFLFENNGRFTAARLLNFLDQVEVQSYLLWQGIKGGMPELRKMTFEEAVELRDKFLMAGELDTGEKVQELIDILGMAVSAANGIDGKKLREKAEKEKEEELARIYKAKIRAEKELEAEKNGIGTQSGETVSEPSTSASESS